ncbi:MAG: EAL domain-containing protein [Gammaproteobacteria bacterium]|nr:EAL domain-containing protein [Gammaproteobacteria bacterium]
MNFRSLRFRIVVFFGWLFATVLAVVFALVTTASYQIARQQSGDDLRLGQRIFHRLQQQTRDRLLQSASVLTADYGFREAISSSHTATIASALQNQRERIGADIMLLSGLDGRAISASGSTLSDNNSELSRHIREAEVRSSAIGTLALGDNVYDVVTIPVLAPEPIAWVTLGFRINDELARDLGALTSLEVTFLHRQATGWSVVASTHGDSKTRSNLARATAAAYGGRPGSEPIETPGYETIAIPGDETDKGTVVIVLQSSSDKAVARFSQLRRTLILLSSLGLLGALVGSIFIARRITRPIQTLAETALQIQRGDYTQPAQIFEKDEIGAFAITFNHMRDAIVNRESEIRRLAYEDALTGLPNRICLEDKLQRMLAEGQVASLAVMIIDLDRFNHVNDTLGHAAGDVVLRIVAQRLCSAVRDFDLVGRFGSDVFALVVRIDDSFRLDAVVKRIQFTIEQDVSVDGEPVDVGCSVGIACYPIHGDDAGTLLRRADIAMHRAKRSHLGSASYEAQNDQIRRDQLNLLGEIRRAIQSDQLSLVYQPKMSVADGAIDGAEALVRWQHPTRGLVPPSEFIPFAEQTGAIRLITRWVIDHAAAQCGIWLRSGHAIKISINVSARDLLDRELPEYVRNTMIAHGAPAKMLCLEITESALMEEPIAAHTTVSRLHDLGIELAIDDYGTGYSSLAYIKQLPVNELKIDRAFVTNMTAHAEDAAIVRSTIELGHNLGLRVVAEGVESDRELALLAKFNCDVAQGYLISRPLGPGMFESWLASYRGRSHPLIAANSA